MRELIQNLPGVDRVVAVSIYSGDVMAETSEAQAGSQKA